MHYRIMIDSRLHVIKTLASCFPVSRPTELTGSSPSADAAQLLEYQRSVGRKLLVKDGRGLRLTATGRHIVDGSDQLVAEWENIRATVLTAGDQTPPEIGIGGFSTAA